GGPQGTDLQRHSQPGYSACQRLSHCDAQSGHDGSERAARAPLGPKILRRLLCDAAADRRNHAAGRRTGICRISPQKAVRLPDARTAAHHTALIPACSSSNSGGGGGSTGTPTGPYTITVTGTNNSAVATGSPALVLTVN